MKTLNVVLLVLVALMTVVIGVLLAPIYIFRKDLRTLLVVKLSNKIVAQLEPPERPTVQYYKHYRGSGTQPWTRREETPPNISDIVFTRRKQAQEAIKEYEELMSEHHRVNVSDLKELVGLEPDYIDKQYGWDDYFNIPIRSVLDGYILDLPTPKRLSW